MWLTYICIIKNRFDLKYWNLVSMFVLTTTYVSNSVIFCPSVAEIRLGGGGGANQPPPRFETDQKAQPD